MLVGAVGRYEEALEEQDWETIRVARLEALKVSVIEKLDNLLVVYHPPTNQQYAPRVQRAYNRGMRHFILHNHPNCIDDGYVKWWKDGQGFSAWWAENIIALRSRFPEAKFGLPAMLPGGESDSVQADSWFFFTECEKALEAADFYELECSWGDAYEMRQELYRVDSHCAHYEKPISVVFCNPRHKVSKAEKAEQYLQFCSELSTKEKVFAAFINMLSSSREADKFIVLRGEQVGAPSVIAERIGERDF
jgi:hypothetical protein